MFEATETHTGSIALFRKEDEERDQKNTMQMLNKDIPSEEKKH